MADAVIETVEEEAPQADTTRLDALGEMIARKRIEAIEGRAKSGIETDWREDQEYYEGIDAAVEGRSDSAWTTKPPGLSEISSSSAPRSKVFVNITRPYVDAASARLADMLLPTDERNFACEPTPVPDSLDGMSRGELMPEHQAQLASAFPDPKMFAQAAQKAQAEAKKMISEANDKAKKAEDQIDDWFIECQYYAEVRKSIENSARIGVGIIKGPCPVKRKSTAYFSDQAGGRMVMKEEIKPGSVSVDPRNLFPDPACGEDVHEGSYVIERDTLTRKKLGDLKGLPGYIESQIDLCLSEGPQKQTATGEMRDSENEDAFEVWHYYGLIDAEDMEAAGCACEPGKTVDAILTLVNDRVIKAARNPMDTGEFPYDVFPWQRREGSWAGIGVARQIRTPQRMVNAAARNMMDNAGVSGGGMFVMKVGAITPADGSYEIRGRKLWYLNEGADEEDVRKAFTYIDIPIRQQELSNIIQFGLKMAEDVTGMPLLLQGQQGKAPDTLGGMQMLNNNANSVLRRLARTFDDRITEPHVRRYYNWLLQYGDDDLKGDLQIYARGSSALVERDAQANVIMGLVQMSLNPIFGLSPARTVKKALSSFRLDPADFEVTEEEQARFQQMSKNRPPDPAVQVAQIEAQQRDKDRQVDIVIARLEQQVEMAKADGKNAVDLEKIKAILAESAMELKTQKELAVASHYADIRSAQVATPPTEPPGRAPNGQAYQA